MSRNRSVGSGRMRRPICTRGWWWLTWLPWRPTCERTGHHNFHIPRGVENGFQWYECDCSMRRGYGVGRRV